MEDPPSFTSERNDPDAKFPHKSALVTFGIFLLIWILVAVHAFSYGDSAKIFPSGHGARDFFNVSRVFTIVSHVLLSGAYSILIFIAMRYIPNFSYLSLATFWIPFPAALILVIIKFNVITVYAFTLFFCSCVLTCNLIGTEWLNLPEKILKESCKAILSSPAAILFSTFYCLFTSLFIIFAIVLHFYLNTLTEADGSYSIFTIVLMILNGIIWLWTFRFIFNVGNMVLTGTYAIWYWGERKRVSSDTVFYCFKLILRYHLGTMALSTSLLGGGKIHRALLKYVIKRFRDKTINTSILCFFLCNLFDKVVFRIISFFALATCMIKGQELPESIEESFQLYLKHARKSLVTIKVVECLLLTAPILTSLLMLMSLHGYLDFSSSDEVETRLNLIMVAFIAMGSLFFVLPLMATLYSACNTLLLCYVEDSSVNDGSTEKPFAMSEELRSTLDHTELPAILRNKFFPCTKISSKVNVYRIS